MFFLTIVFTLIGYLSGSVLYANVFGSAFGVKELYKKSADRNPGTTNAYKYGGFWCGTLTLICDVMKGFLPIFLFLRISSLQAVWILSPVLSAPVLGHIFSLFEKFHGGKGIATTFGCLLGLFPYMSPVLIFAAVFIFLSIILRITPNYYRTAIAYLATAVCMVLGHVAPAVWVGFIICTVAVCLRLYLSDKEKEKMRISILWIR